MPVFSWFRNEGANFSSPYPIPGQRFDSVVLKVGCTRNFYTIAPNGRMKYHDMVLKCVDGQWSDEIPQCTSTSSNSKRYINIANRDDGIVQSYPVVGQV